MITTSNIGSSEPAISVTFAANSPISRERARAKSRASALTETRMRDITPRLRKFGRASGRSFCRILCTFVRTQKSTLAAVGRALHDFSHFSVNHGSETQTRQETLVRAVRRTRIPARQALHRLDPVLPAPRAPRHPGVARPSRHAFNPSGV